MEDKARRIIEENIYCTIATADLNGKPWISPVFFGYDEDYNIYWVSDRNALHSQLIRNNPQISIVFFNSQAPEGDGDGVYIEAKAEEINDKDEAEIGYKIRDSRVIIDTFRVKDVSEVIDNGVWRVYRATPINISKLTEGEYVNGQY